MTAARGEVRGPLGSSLKLSQMCKGNRRTCPRGASQPPLHCLAESCFSLDLVLSSASRSPWMGALELPSAAYKTFSVQNLASRFLAHQLRPGWSGPASESSQPSGNTARGGERCRGCAYEPFCECRSGQVCPGRVPGAAVGALRDELHYSGNAQPGCRRRCVELLVHGPERQGDRRSKYGSRNLRLEPRWKLVRSGVEVPSVASPLLAASLRQSLPTSLPRCQPHASHP